jgi:hypothetical protein
MVNHSFSDLGIPKMRYLATFRIAGLEGRPSRRTHRRLEIDAIRVKMPPGQGGASFLGVLFNWWASGLPFG